MRIICPACGINMMLPDDDPGGVVECGGCGKQIAFGASEPERNGADFSDNATFGVSGKHRRSKQKKNWRSVIIGGSVGVMATAIVIVLTMVEQRTSTPPKPGIASIIAPAPALIEVPWDRSHRSELLTLKSQAESLAIAGKWRNLTTPIDKF